MTIKTLFMQNVQVPARDARQVFAVDWDEGVKGLTSFKVTPRALGANRSVDVSAGSAIVRGDDQAGQGNYYAWSDAVVNVPLDPYPAGANQRYDLIILQTQDPDATGPAGDNTIVTKVTGAAFTSPVVPALPASAVLLAVIGPLTAATVSVTAAVIHDAQTGTGPPAAAAAHLHAGERCAAGSLKDFAGRAGMVPNGWLPCDGSSLLRAAYPDLYATIGVDFGAADGTHFTLPDFRGRVAVGAGTGSGLTARTTGATGGEEAHQLIQGETPLKSHGHGVTDPTHPHSITDPQHQHALPVRDTPGVSASALNNDGTGMQSSSEPASTGITVNAAATGITINAASDATAAAHNNMPPFAVVYKIIRT